ncbi:cytochrome c biogenesis heme-transporting ATPase CcmA [Pseudomonas typographi]|uniref:cytochrome c biogenesis heme-transporting ATPase CcmA n=1 Tax=Pseudomonas typographi TaxID=2715964 RepID=UPI00168405F7|nr:cytochrome c biogenesis heme-transporting ATPase CcmA [Pseudomonas typographi]
MNPYLQASALACERDGRLLFEHLALSLGAGDMLQVSGPNGAGKTSLLRVLAGLMAPTAGHVRCTAKPLWVGHAAGIQERLSAEENLAWLCALHATAPGKVPATAPATEGRAAYRAPIWQALAEVGLRGFEDVPCHSLSAGQKRRVALARLYLPAPRLWVLDEPFTALDIQAVAQLEAHLAAHCEQGGAVVLTTHHLLGRRPPGFAELALGGATA